MGLEELLVWIAFACIGIALVGGLGARFYYLFRSKQEPPKYREKWELLADAAICAGQLLELGPFESTAVHLSQVRES